MNTARLSLLVVLFAVALTTSAQKKTKPLIDIPIDEQRARVAAQHLPVEPYLLHEGDTVIFQHRIERPGLTTAQLHDLSREALLEIFDELPAGRFLCNGHDRLMLSTVSTINGVHPTLSSHSDINQKINICTRPGVVYLTIRLNGFAVTVTGFDGYGHQKTNTEKRRLSSRYPINPDSPEPLASWNDINDHYYNILNQIKTFEEYITRRANLFLPE